MYMSEYFARHAVDPIQREVGRGGRRQQSSLGFGQRAGELVHGCDEFFHGIAQEGNESDLVAGA